MKKRFKPGAQVVLTDGDELAYLTAHLMELRLSHCTVRLSAEDIRRIQAADLLEPVPEPKTAGQVLEDALRAEGFAPLSFQLGDFERVARRLGIKPEDE